jgi:hypothetical protein
MPHAEERWPSDADKPAKWIGKAKRIYRAGHESHVRARK